MATRSNLASRASPSKSEMFVTEATSGDPQRALTQTSG